MRTGNGECLGDAGNRRASLQFLRDAGYRVIEAATAGEAIAVLASGARVDLVFSDVNLAEEMNGHALANWLASNHPQTPMLLTSADRDELCRITVGATRATLSKPYDLAIVAERIREILLR